MPIPSGYSRSTFHGSLSGGEVFNFSLWANEAPADQAATQAQATAFATELLVAPTTGQMSPWKLMATQDSFTGVRVYSYATATGHATYIAEAGATQAGSGLAANRLPPQCSLVVTLKSPVAGRRATGRVYLPATNMTMGTNGQTDLTTTQQVAAWFANFITRLNSHIGAQKIGILSQKGGTFQPCTSVSVNSVIDIQRRRANKLIASSVTSVPVV